MYYMNYGVETIKRQIRAAYGSFVAGSKSRCRGLIPLYARFVCDTKAPLQLQLPLMAPYKCCAFTFMPLHTDLVVRDEYLFAHVIVHRRHRVRDLVQNEIYFAFHLMSVWNATHQLLHDLRSHSHNITESNCSTKPASTGTRERNGRVRYLPCQLWDW